MEQMDFNLLLNLAETNSCFKMLANDDNEQAIELANIKKLAILEMSLHFIENVTLPKLEELHFSHAPKLSDRQFFRP